MGDVDELRLTLRAQVLVDADMVGLLRMMVGYRMQLGGAADGDDSDRVPVEVRGHHVYSLAGELAGLGDHVEVLGPPRSAPAWPRSAPSWSSATADRRQVPGEAGAG